MLVHDDTSKHTVYHFYAKCKVCINENTFFFSILLKTTRKIALLIADENSH